MPQAFIPFGEMAPDQGAFNNPNLHVALNVVPFSDGYVPAPYLLGDISPTMNNGPAWAMGSHTNQVLGALASFYVHSDSRLYESTISAAGGTTTDRSRSAGSIRTYAVTAGGAGYAPGDTGTITAPAGCRNATYTVNTVTAGAVTSFTVNDKGTGFTTGAGKATVVVTGVGNGLFTVNVTAVDPYANTLANLIQGGSFCAFGKYMIYTNKVDAPQYRDVTTATAFAPLITTTAPTGSSSVTGNPRARFVSWIKNHLVLGNIDMTDNTATGGDAGGILSGGAYGGLAADNSSNVGVWWSATDNINRFANPAAHPMIIGSDFQMLNDDLGPVTGLSPGGDWINVFKERGIYYMSGPPFAFDLVTTEVGCAFPRSIVRLGDDVYFWSMRGPCVLRGGRQFSFLSNGKIEAFIKSGLGSTSDPSNSPYATLLLAMTRGNYGVVTGAASQFDGTIVWNIATSSPTGDVTVTLVVYFDTNTGRWSVGYPLAVEPSVGVPTKLPIGKIYGMTSYSNAHSLIDTKWSPCLGIASCSEDPGAGSPSLNVRVFKNDSTAATAADCGPVFITENLQLKNGSAARITKVRPVFQCSENSVTNINDFHLKFLVEVVIESSSAPLGSKYPLFTGTISSQNDHGWINIPDSKYGDFNRIGVAFYDSGNLGDPNHTSEIIKFQGMMIEYEMAGARSKPI